MSDFLSNRRMVDPVLTKLATGIAQGEFISERAFPVVTTEKEGLRVPVWSDASFTQQKTLREINAKSNKVEIDTTESIDVVLCEYDLATGVDYRVNYESMWDERKKAVRRVVNLLRLQQEIQTAGLIGDAKNYNTKLVSKVVAKDAWNNANFDPVKAIFEAKEKVRDLTGFVPNVLILDRSIYNALKFNTAVQKYKGTSANYIALSQDDLTEILELDEILVGNAHYTKDKEGLKNVWSGFASLITRTKELTNPDETNPSFGYTFRRKGMPVVDSYKTEGGKIEIQRYTDIRATQIVGSNSGYLFVNPLNTSLI